MDVLVTTINLAAIYGLIGVGISLTWAGLGFLNLAHGVTFAAGRLRRLVGGAEHLRQLGRRDARPASSIGALAGVIICVVVFLPLDGRINWDYPLDDRDARRSASSAPTSSWSVFGPQNKQLAVIFGTDKFRIGETVITADKSGAIISSAVVMSARGAGARRRRAWASGCAR